MIAVAGFVVWRTTAAERAAGIARYRGLILAMLALTLLAGTPRLTAGHLVLVPVNLHFLDRLLGIVRASGRAFWIVEYALVLGSVAVLAARMRPVWFASVMAVVVVLQWVDAGPLRRHGERYLAGVGQTDRTIPIPADTVLYRTVPSCGLYGVRADEWRLQALRAGARLGDARLAHEPTVAGCAARLATGLGDKLEPGETRLFLPEVEGQVHASALDAVCGETGAGLLCHRGAAQ